MPTRSADDIRAEIFSLVDEYYNIKHRPNLISDGQLSAPVSGRVYDSSDMRSLVDSALDFWLTTGRFNDAFEKRLAEFLGVKYAMTVNSGSSANLVALATLTSHLLRDRALKPGDEIITTSTGFPTTVNPALLYGMVPVFVDVHIPTYNIDPAKIEAAISPKTRAIMVAHTLGNPIDLGVVMDIAKRYDLFVIEDSCDALGALYDGKRVGTFGDIGTVSFYPAHHITMGEGGAVFMNRPLLQRAAESIRDWGRDCYCAPGKDNTCGKRFEWKLGDLPKGYDHKYTYSHLGFNLKITDMQAAVGLSQMDHLEDFIAARQRNFALLWNRLADLQHFLILPEATPNSEPSWFGFPITVRDDAPFTRDQLSIELNRLKIGTRLLFGGNLIRQPYMRGRNFRISGDSTQSDRVMRQTFWIGVYPGLEPTQIDYMADVIHTFCGTPHK